LIAAAQENCIGNNDLFAEGHATITLISALAEGADTVARAAIEQNLSVGLPFEAESRMEVFAMIYELRVYHPVPGQMPKLLARFRDQALPIWEKHGIRPIGFWTTLVGKSSNELTYILPWESLADRETRWTAFQNDSSWQKVRDDSERDGPIVASISNQILTPTAFSALK
jgi:hypothetical protein